MLKPDPAACCPDAYYCTTVNKTLCHRHHSAPPACSRRCHHSPVDRAAWHRAHDLIEQHLLNEVFTIARDAERTVTPGRTLAGALDVVLGVMTPSTLGPVHDVTPAPVG